MKPRNPALASLKNRPPEVWGIDVGGANLKLCSPSGRCAVTPFPMWTDHQRLGTAVQQLISELTCSNSEDRWNQNSQLAVTMTGELSDCFPTRQTGVSMILNQLTTVASESQCQVYSVEGRWLSVRQAKESAWTVAASNWHALASWCLLQNDWNPQHLTAIVDIGSTTVDVIPILEGRIATNAQTDRQRMQLGQLVYTGMERTPIHAMVRSLKVDGIRCPVMAERFATIHDANLVLGSLQDEPDNRDTADGRPRTRRFALARLARMIGEDAETLPESAIVELARQVCVAQAKQVAKALWRNLPTEIASVGKEPCRSDFRVLVSGHGRPLVERLERFSILRSWRFEYLEDILGADTARCAPALAVAQLCSLGHCVA